MRAPLTACMLTLSTVRLKCLKFQKGVMEMPQESEFKTGDQVLATTRRGSIRCIIVRTDPIQGFDLVDWGDKVRLGWHKRNRISCKLEKLFTDN